MDSIFTFSDLQHFVAIKLLLFIFILFALLGIYKKWGSVYLIWLGAICSAAAYFLLVNNLELPFWGLKADEITIMAMYERFAHGGFWTDFNYAHLPAFYPSLFFQLVAVIGKFANWNGVQMAKFSVLVTILVFPILLYHVQKLMWKHKQDQHAPHALAWVLGTAFVFILAGWDAVITKPYELVSATGVILWATFLSIDVYEQRMNLKKLIAYGIIGGLLFWMFYFWFFLAAIGIGYFNLFTKGKVTLRQYGQFLLVGIITLLVSVPFWFPLARAYAAHGAENWQLGFFTIEWITTQLPAFAFSVHGIVLLIGLIGLIAWRHILYIRALLALFCAGLTWQAMGLSTILLFASPLQESKGYLFFSTSILAFGAAYAIEKWWLHYETKFKVSHTTAALVALLVIAPQLPFGTFADSEKVQEVRVRAKVLKPELRELATFLATQNVQRKVILTSGIPELHAFVPFTEFIYFNQHNSHPAALFSERLAFVKQLTTIRTSQDFYDTIRTHEFAPELMIFYKGGERKDAYPLYFNLDNFPHRIREETLYLPKSLLDSNKFEIVFENGAYIVFRVIK